MLSQDSTSPYPCIIIHYPPTSLIAMNRISYVCPTIIQLTCKQTQTPLHGSYEIIGKGESCAKPGIPTVPPMERTGANYVMYGSDKSICDRSEEWGSRSADDAEPPKISIYPAIPCNVNKCKHALRHRMVRPRRREVVLMGRMQITMRHAMLMMFQIISVTAIDVIDRASSAVEVTVRY